ncbi:hypothetical protein L208DRAFT_1233989, partial [Tricholoma matsutake]
IRSEGHEMLPNFIGRWFPRKDRGEDHELYAACMLLLLQPWTSLLQLKGAIESFGQAFVHFYCAASPESIFRIDNIQYYYQCSDHAK